MHRPFVNEGAGVSNGLTFREQDEITAKEKKTKVCSHCKKEKSLSKFSKNKSNKDGIAYWCKKCMNVAMHEWQKRNPHKIRNKQLEYDYNLTLDEYNKMFNQQKGCCAICGIHQSKLKQALCVDHNHKSGKIRKLICKACNYKVGIVENNNFEKICNYLDKYDD